MKTSSFQDALKAVPESIVIQGESMVQNPQSFLDELHLSINNDDRKIIMPHITYREFLSKNLQELSVLLSGIRNVGSQKVCLEGGHIYVDQSVSMEILLNIKYTGFLKRFLEVNGLEVAAVLFVDDYNPSKEDNIFNMGDYLRVAERAGITFDHIILESSMHSVAKEMVAVLSRLNMVVNTAEGIHFHHRQTKLYDKKEDKYSCALLDAGLTLIKFLQIGDSVVNVLPLNYNSQQKKTRSLVSGVLKTRQLPFFNFFVDAEGSAHRAGTPRWTDIKHKNVAQTMDSLKT